MNRLFTFGFARAAGSLFIAGLCSAGPAAPIVLPGLRADGTVLLPNQWALKPTGQQIGLGDFPTNVALYPKGHYAAVLHCGFSDHEVWIVDLETGKKVDRAGIDEAFYGLAWSPDGKRLFCSGASQEVIHVFDFARGRLSHHRTFRIRAESKMGVPVGLAVSENGRELYVAEGWGQYVDKLDSYSGKVIWSRSLAPAENAALTRPEGERLEPSENPDAPFPYTCAIDQARQRLYVSLWAKSSVLVLDLKSGAELARWSVGEHPNELALTDDGRLFVAEANRNTVSILDVNTGRVLETLSGAMNPNDPPGAMPNSVTLSRDQKTLFVANANNNDVAVFDVSSRAQGKSLGLIPVGWFPTAVRVTPEGRRLIVANGKGISSAPNPRGPFPGDHRPENLQQYIGGLFKGTLSVIELPRRDDQEGQFGKWTRDALATRPESKLAGRPEDNPIPRAIGASSPIQHVIYVVKENRTYDQILGDMREGNGDARLCLFGENVTPNEHALAREFVLLDNFYVDGEVSADGHEWTMGAQATDFVEKTWPLNYGHSGKKIGYPGEAAYPISVPAKGYLWNQAARAGVTYRSYGEFVYNGKKPGDVSTPAIRVLQDHIDPYYRGFDLRYPDTQRAGRFIAELSRYEKEGEMPRLQVVRLGNDHTEGSTPGRLTPTALVADNDLALGQIVEAVSHSKFWNTTAIFILEDDAQNGPDHVDAHRSPAFVVSPYTRRGVVDSTMYSTTSMLHTIELILGLEPMSQYDAVAAPMYQAFAAQPNFTPFSAKAARVNLAERNSPTAWGARQSERMDFHEADRVDDIVLNEIVWRSVKGANSPMPPPVRAAFFRVNKAEGDDD